jgi:hypothetical protein
MGLKTMALDPTHTLSPSAAPMLARPRRRRSSCSRCRMTRTLFAVEMNLYMQNML